MRVGHLQLFCNRTGDFNRWSESIPAVTKSCSSLGFFPLKSHVSVLRVQDTGKDFRKPLVSMNVISQSFSFNPVLQDSAKPTYWLVNSGTQ